MIFDKNLFGQDKIDLKEITKIEMQTFNVNDRALETTNAYWNIYTSDSFEPFVWPVDSDIEGDENCWNALQSLENF